MARIRLLKVTVQPVFVLDETDGIEELVGQPIVIQGKHWQSFAKTAFCEDELKSIAEQYAAEKDKPRQNAKPAKNQLSAKL